jgi:hypothetical protein
MGTERDTILAPTLHFKLSTSCRIVVQSWHVLFLVKKQYWLYLGEKLAKIFLYCSVFYLSLFMRYTIILSIDEYTLNDSRKVVGTYGN